MFGFASRFPLLLAASAILASTLAAPAQSQIVPAPDWCGELLNTRPEPTPILQLSALAKGIALSKGAYETTAAFEQRSESKVAERRASLEKIFGSSYVVAEVPISSEYNADRGQFTSKLMLTMPFTTIRNVRNNPEPPSGYYSIKLISRLKSSDKYEGQNAFGVTKTVTREMRDEYGLSFLNLRMGGGRPTWLTQEVKVALPPDKAAAIDGKLSVLIVGELIAPGIIEGFELTKPTLNDPREIIEDQHSVTVRAACAGIVARGSRELLHRVN